ncbi:hypothetical protein Slin15195_G127540 [Septoria linicola]|uniref:Secreted protein n=1 Tax=Septoria linicola TaxID=215465 RepID=A0A9Q9B2G6_9PEZI|nr:hypothetical protein Slin14017_G083720 [Septoria linicola]USW59435.1 hypothetical protein Slin15195_G127540 [Septoria linicola]
MKLFTATILTLLCSSVSAWTCIIVPNAAPNGYCVPNDDERNAGGLTQWCAWDHPCKVNGNGCYPNAQPAPPPKVGWRANCS